VLERGGAHLWVGREKCKVEVKLLDPEPGRLELPGDLEEDLTLDLSCAGRCPTPKEAADLRGSGDRDCSICSEEMGSSTSSSSSTTAQAVDEDGDAVMEESNASCAWRAPCSAEGAVFKLHCGHFFHTNCIKRWFEQRAQCPLCQKDFGKVVGTQPRVGAFHWHLEMSSLPGHGGKRIVIQFEFPAGQNEDGVNYPSRRERGYLPGNCEGILQLELFKVAFRRRVMFGLGTSMTSGRFRPTFNIHIKTKCSGGPTHHGYPDPDYFQRSMDELKRNGITLADLPS
ncbi:unnamed protein product, partial [Effrenium voratum]